MNKSKHYDHGGDIYSINNKYGIEECDLINFSGNVNPLGISKKVKKSLVENIDKISNYPDKSYNELKLAISNYIDVSKDNILVGNGSSELISYFIRSINPKIATIIGPSYSEYERELYMLGSKFNYYFLDKDNSFILDVDKFISSISPNTDLIIICNPNNPTSSIIDIDNLHKILDFCIKNNIYVLIDETYIEFVEDINNYCSIPLINKYSNLFIIRGTSKFFAVPGIRLGYAICSNKELLEKINYNKEPWSVNVLANIAGIEMFNDIDYINNTKDLINTERQNLVCELNKFKNLDFTYPYANFILVKILNNTHVNELFEYLINKNILIRDCSSFPTLDDKYFRFCILNTCDNSNLISFLKKLFE